MDFTITGTLNSYVKTKNLTFAAKHKLRTGQTLTNSNGNFVSITTSTFDKLTEAAKASNEQAKQQKLRRIKQKLMNGRKISEEEMGFLRVNDPKTYKKAKHAEEAREDLKEELKKAKSKSEAREAMARAMIKASTEAMAELGALGQCNGAMGGGSPGNGLMTSDASLTNATSGDVGSINVSGGEVSSAETNTNVSGTENQSFSEVNQSIQNTDDKSSTDKNSDEKNFAVQKKSDDDSTTPEDIMEKYIMTIRALEDEWARFTESDEYKNLPENTLDDKKIVADKKVRKQIDAPKRIFLNAAILYRKSMLLPLNAE
ncbi:MAG: hypothetical protein IKT98_01020 [Selenomonadaceae bacterium]|nr:hypothetical protein [Selenomonadaceae bacterium]